MVTAAPGPGLVAEAGNQGRKSLNYSGWCGAGPRYAWNGTKNLDHANYSEPAHCSPPRPAPARPPARRGAALANERPGGGHVTSAANEERGLGPGAVRPVQTRFRRSLTARGGHHSPVLATLHTANTIWKIFYTILLKNVTKTCSLYVLSFVSAQ